MGRLLQTGGERFPIQGGAEGQKVQQGIEVGLLPMPAEFHGRTEQLLPGKTTVPIPVQRIEQFEKFAHSASSDNWNQWSAFIKYYRKAIISFYGLLTIFSFYSLIAINLFSQ
jgi:hypothetical protein